MTYYTFTTIRMKPTRQILLRNLTTSSSFLHATAVVMPTAAATLKRPNNFTTKTTMMKTCSRIPTINTIHPTKSQSVVPQIINTMPFSTLRNSKIDDDMPTVSSSSSHATTATQPDDEIITYIIDDHILKITLNRPRAANAMGSKMISQLTPIIDNLKTKNSNVRCVILTSASQRVFSAGADLRERETMSREEAVAFVDSLRRCFDDIANLPQPVLAVIEGVAVGGGLELALAADIRISSSAATFGLPETTLAIVPGAGGTQRLPRLIGTARAMELILTGRRIEASTALEYGLVQHVVEEGGGVEEVAIDMARDIARNGPIAVTMAKRAIRKGLEAANFDEALKIEKDCYSAVIPTSDRLEGLAAFRERRRPVYRGQ